MDDILGIVGHNNFETNRIFLFIGKNVLEDPVQAIGLRRGSVVRAHGQVNVAESGLEFADFLQRRLIVRVCADEEVVVAVENRSAVLLYHPAR